MRAGLLPYPSTLFQEVLHAKPQDMQNKFCNELSLEIHLNLMVERFDIYNGPALMYL
jgi:hypothetical protein